jgi:hypothetical protein
MKSSRSLFLAVLVFISQTAFAQQRVASIRSVDFSDFTFTWTSGLRLPGEPRTFRLKGGEAPRTEYDLGVGLTGVTYGDVTGDGVEEAIVNLSIHTGGSSMPNSLYIYTIRRHRPRLLWAFETGDRADGGLRRIYPEDGTLVVELYGEGTRVGGKLYGTENAPACCAKSVTRTRYRWSGRKFQQVGKSEVFPNPAA